MNDDNLTNGPIVPAQPDGAPLTPHEQATIDQMEAGFDTDSIPEPEQPAQSGSEPASSAGQPSGQSAANHAPRSDAKAQPDANPENTDTPSAEDKKQAAEDEAADEKKSMAKQASKDTARRTALYAGAEIGKEIVKDAAKDVAHGAAQNAAKHEAKKVTGAMIKGAAKSGVKKAAKKTLKRAIFKYIFGFGIPTLGIIGILFFLLLFKSVHIRNIYIDYEFAKFDRAFSRRLQKAAKEAQAKGTPTTEVAADATPEEQLKGANKDAIDQIKNDPAAMEKEAKAGTDFEQTKAGVGGETDLEFGIKRSVAPEDETDPRKAQTAVETEIKDEIRGPKGTTGDPGPLKNAVDEANKQADAGATPEEIRAGAIKNVGSLLSGVTGKAAAALFIATMGCIARDIYVTSVDLFSQIKLSALARTAASIAKHADCHREVDNHCGLASEAAVSQMFDSATESFINTAGYQRATNQPVSYAKSNRDLDPAMEPVNHGTGLAGELMGIINSVNSVANFPGLGSVCTIVLTPAFQITATISLVLAQVALAISGVADFGLSDVVLAAVTTAAQILATKAGTALAVDAVLHYSGLIFRGPFTPTQIGNMMDAGSKVMSSDACMRSGCHQLTPAQNQQLSDSIHHDQVEYAQRQGIAYRLFSPENPNSVLGLVADRVPSHVGSAVTMVQTAIINNAVPGRWLKMLGQLAAASPTTAYAATAEYQTYNLPDWGVPDSEADKYGVIENSRWVEANIDAATKTKFEDCFNTPMNKMLTKPGLTDLAFCNDITEPITRYRIFKLDQRASHALVVLNNNQAK